MFNKAYQFQGLPLLFTTKKQRFLSADRSRALLSAYLWDQFFNNNKHKYFRILEILPLFRFIVVVLADATLSPHSIFRTRKLVKFYVSYNRVLNDTLYVCNATLLYSQRSNNICDRTDCDSLDNSCWSSAIGRRWSLRTIFGLRCHVVFH